jgi:hypothetical protein
VSFATSVIQSITASSARVRCVHAGP